MVWKALADLPKGSSLNRICFYDPVEDFLDSESWFIEWLERRMELREMYLLLLSLDFCEALSP